MPDPTVLNVTAEFHVQGYRDQTNATADPPAQGSSIIRNAGGKSFIVSSNATDLNRWRKLVRAAFLATGAREIPAGVPVGAFLEFSLRRPAHVPPERDGRPSTYPDLDKLSRAAFDALSYDKKKEQPYAYRDDGQVVELYCRKRYAAPGELPGAAFKIYRVERGFTQPSLFG